MKNCLQLIFTPILLTIAFSSFSQYDLNGDVKGNLWDPTIQDSIGFEITYSSACSIMDFGENDYCGINFPAMNTVWSGNTNEAISTITYTFSKKIYSIDIMLGVVGIEGSPAPETFEFTTNDGIPEVKVNSGSCSAWKVVKNVTTCPYESQAFTALHTISTENGFTELVITTDSSGSGEDSNGGSNFAIVKGSVKAAESSNLDDKKREAGG